MHLDAVQKLFRHLTSPTSPSVQAMSLKLAVECEEQKLSGGQPAQGTPAEPILQLGLSSQVQTSLPTPNLSRGPYTPPAECGTLLS